MSMRAIKNPAPDAATSKRDNETRAPGQATPISVIYDTTSENKKQYPIESFLPRGAENALSTAYLVQLTGCSSARMLQKAIEAERERGVLILSATTGGYFLPDYGEKGKREIAEYVRTLQARALNTLKAAKAARKALEVLEGQATIYYEGNAWEKEKAARNCVSG